MTVSKQIIEVIDALCEKFGVAIDWTAENVLPYLATLCEKLIKYTIFTSSTSLVVNVLVIVGLIIGTIKLVPIFAKKIKEQDFLDMGWTMAAAFSGIGAGVIAMFCIMSIIHNFDLIAKCVIFPEMYIIEYVKTLIG